MQSLHFSLIALIGVKWLINGSLNQKYCLYSYIYDYTYTPSSARFMGDSLWAGVHKFSPPLTRGMIPSLIEEDEIRAGLFCRERRFLSRKNELSILILLDLNGI